MARLFYCFNRLNDIAEKIIFKKQEFAFKKLTYFTIFARVASFACARIAAQQIVRAGAIVLAWLGESAWQGFLGLNVCLIE